MVKSGNDQNASWQNLLRVCYCIGTKVVLDDGAGADDDENYCFYSIFHYFHLKVAQDSAIHQTGLKEHVVDSLYAKVRFAMAFAELMKGKAVEFYDGVAEAD
eukprot:5340518-Karenia_brevis.AAC.1